MMIGAAIFKNKTYDAFGSNDGYYCLTGQSPVSFSGTGQLSSNVRWLTNISVESAFNAQLKNTPRLLDDKYLRISTSSLILELGLKARSIEDQAETIAHVFSNVMKLSAAFFGVDEPPQSSLASGIVGQISHIQPKIKDVKVLDAAQKSIVQFTNCERRITTQAKLEYVSVIIPRDKHANKMLELGAPWDDFFFLSDNQLPKGPQRLAWVLSSDLPMLCKVTISNIDDRINHLINWGNGAGLINKLAHTRAPVRTLNQREYVTSNELKFLSEFCEIEIDQVAISNTPVEKRHALPDVGGLTSLSYSFGIIAENLWCSLLRDQKGKYIHTPMTSWVHANDRIECFGYAKALSDQGFIVNGYGYGRITLAIESSRKDELKKAAINLGLLPFLDLDILNEELDITTECQPSELLKILYSCGHLPFIMHMDDAYVSGVLNSNGH